MLLTYANLTIANNAPYNQDYRDIYYQPQHGFEESNHTFIHANHLPQRFANLRTGQAFCIGEIGFGSALNALNTIDHFLRHAPSQSHLHYCSVEKHPIELNTLKTLHQHWCQPKIRAQLYQQYPHNHSGIHTLHLHPRIHLHLLLGDAHDLLPQLHAKIDAWYLDGFAPSKNPQCWQAPLFAHIARTSHPTTTLSSFSAARILRDNLQAHGFHIQKQTGYANKRDMITATYRPTTPIIDPTPLPAWCTPPTPPKKPRIAIIGAGIAGAATAHALARTHTIDLYHHPKTHPPASHVPLAIPYLQPDSHDTPMRRYHLSAWHHAHRHYHQLRQQNPSVFTPCPIHAHATNNKTKQRHQQLANQTLLNPQHLSHHNHQLRYQQTGLLNPRALINTLLEHPNIHHHLYPITQLKRHNHYWQIAHRLYDIIILATGWHTALYPEPNLAHAIRPVRGQGTLLTLHHIPKPIVHIHNKTTIPYPNQPQIYAGASYSPNSADLTPNPQHDEQNRQAYLKAHPQQNSNHIQISQSFVGIRGASRDYFPLVGAIAQSADVIAKYHPWRKDARRPIHHPLKHHLGLYLNTAHGSKGMTTAFLNADLITALINQTPLPLDRHLLPHLLPARIPIRQIIRQQL